MAEILPIVKEPHKVLRGKARDVAAKEITSAKIKRLISGMKETLKNTPNGVGLAAPQVGVSGRIFIVSEEAEEIDRSGRTEVSGKKPDEKREWKYYAFINPVVKNISKKKVEDAEGCLSVPEKYGTVKRHEKITVEAYNEAGKKFTRGASKFFARVVQHELDHLNGTLFIDKVEKYLEPITDGK